MLKKILLILAMIVAVGYRFSTDVFGFDTYLAKWFYFNGATALSLVLCTLLALHVKGSLKWHVWSLAGLLCMYLIRDSFHMGVFKWVEWVGVGLFVISIIFKQIHTWSQS